MILNNNYNNDKLKNYNKLKKILNMLPKFTIDFFRSIEYSSSIKTRIGYAYDISSFFKFLIKNNPTFKNYKLESFKLSDINNLKPVDIEEYLDYLKYYQNDNHKIQSNSERGISRKISSLNSFYQYYVKNMRLDNNPIIFIRRPKIHEKNIIRLDKEEIETLLNFIEKDCEKVLTKQEKIYYKKNKKRDLAIITLLLGTGIRVSECVGLNLQDINFNNNSIKITRKGGNESIIYFGDEIKTELNRYIKEVRSITIPYIKNETALFLSAQRKRMSVCSIENMIKKYTSKIIINKKITPHKLRSTYGTNLYRKTGDIYLVADILGHKDVNTTKRYYAAISEDSRKNAANIIKLRKNKN